MSDFIWGLTTQDLGNAFWNGISQNAMFLGGMAVAGTTAMVAHRILVSHSHSGQSSAKKPLLCALIGIGVGIAASLNYADRLHHVNFAADKALKFLVLSLVTGAIGLKAGRTEMVISLITLGGAFGYFGRGVLHAHGTIGAVIGVGIISWVTYFNQN
jgi:hypothetical protein